MTKDEIRDMSRVVAPHFGLWTPGHYPVGVNAVGSLCCSHCGRLVDLRGCEIPCPDLTEPAWAWRLLMAFVAYMNAKPVVERNYDYNSLSNWAWDVFNEADAPPEEALLLAAYQLVQREAPK